MKVSAQEKNYFRAFYIRSNIVVFHNSQSHKPVVYMYNVND